MEVKRLRTLGSEISKTLNKLNSTFVKEIFQRTKWLTYGPNNTQVSVHKTAKYGGKKLKTLGRGIWNSLPEHIKAETNFTKFKEYINYKPVIWTNLQI